MTSDEPKQPRPDLAPKTREELAAHLDEHFERFADAYRELARGVDEDPED